MGRKGQDIGWRGTLADRFESKTIPEPNSGCLLWLGAVRVHRWSAYGVMRDASNKLAPATHIALRLIGKEVPKGMYACHRCDNPYCVNADHLFIGTPLENVEDMCRKGRQKFYGSFARWNPLLPPLTSFHARDWARNFCTVFPDVDLEVAKTWFAHALLRGYDEGMSGRRRTASLN